MEQENETQTETNHKDTTEILHAPSSVVEIDEVHESDYVDKKVEPADERSFWTMVILATQNAFNDKAAQTMLIALGVFLANAAFKLKQGVGMSLESLSTESAKSSAWISPAFAILILIPFIFLAPLAGWVSDRFSKTNVLRFGALMQMVVLGFIFWTIQIEHFNLAIVGFGLLALQSTILSPAKKGIVKEMVGSERLGFASGVLELSSVLAICVGQIVSGFWFNSRLAESDSPWLAVNWPILLLFILSVPAFLASFSLKVYPSPGKRPFKPSIIWEHVGQMKDLLGDSKIRLSALAIAFFWFVGGFINIVAIQVANQLTSGTTGGMGVELAYMLSAASGGMILGGTLASYSCRRSIELGLVPIGGIFMVAGSIALAFSPVEGAWFKLWIGFTGFGAAIFLVPLNAYLQDNCSEEKRGKVIAGSNLLDCFAGAGAVGLFIWLSAIDVPISTQFIILAVLSAGVTVYATKILPQHFFRFTVLTFLRVFYRKKVLNASRIPKYGGVLIVPNHISYIDAFILTSSSTRPIRFLMTDEYFKKRGVVRLFLTLFDTVPISEKRAKDAIQKASDAVLEGGVVCIFPEGQLSRTGSMNELKRGYEMIARKAKCPVIPVYMDGLWGSIFSFERGKFIKKWPYRFQYGVTVNWGEPIEYSEANTTRVRHDLMELGMDAFKERAQLENPEKTIKKAKVNILAGDINAWESLLNSAKKLSESEQYRLIYNGLQLSELHAICRGDIVAIRLDELEELALSLGVLFPVLAKLKLIIITESTTKSELEEWDSKYDISSYIGAEKLLEQLKQAPIKTPEFYHLGAVEVSETHYPVYAVDGLVVAMSMPHPVAVTATNQFQLGWKEGSYGRLLPGYSLGSEDAQDERKSVYLPKSNSPLTQVIIDKEGFVMVK